MRCVKLLVVLIFVGFGDCAVRAQMYDAGTTWFPIQHNGTVGRMIVVDPAGWVQVVWMRGLIANQTGPRHVYWSAWSPDTHEFVFPNGQQVNATVRAGFVTLAGDSNGWAYPAFHEFVPSDNNAHVSAGIDFLPRVGAYSAFHPDWRSDATGFLPNLYPKIAMAANGELHVVSSDLPNPDPAVAERIFYSRGVPLFEEFEFGLGIDWDNVHGNEQFLPLDTSVNISHDIACATQSQRVAVAYAHALHTAGIQDNSYSNDIYLLLSEDGGETWNEPINVTQFIPPDLECYQETGNGLCCSRDTLRAFGDLSLLFDDEDNVHIAFTTIRYLQWNEEGERDVRPSAAQIWHWSESSGIFSIVAQNWILEPSQTLSLMQTAVQKPSLTQDAESGDLFCAYQRLDTAQVTAEGNFSADVWISRSIDGGIIWSAGTNVTNTPTAPNSPSGQHQSERDPSLALNTNEANLCLFYQLMRDIDFGQGENMLVEAEMKLARIPINGIPDSPRFRARMFHVEDVDCPPITAGDFVLLDSHYSDAEMGTVTSIQAADFDDDEDEDIAATIAESGRLVVWMNNGDSAWTLISVAETFPDVDLCVVGDFDGDDDPDIAASGNTGELRWWENAGSMSFNEHVIDELFHRVLALTSDDLNLDGTPDIVCSLDLFANVVGFTYHRGEGFETVPLLHLTGEPPLTELQIARNFVGDIQRDAVCASFENGFIRIAERGDNGYNLLGNVNRYALPWISGVAAGDFNRDGRADIVASSSSRGRIHWFRNDGVNARGEPVFSEHQVTRNFPWVNGLYARDLNGDGATDLLATAEEGVTLAMWANRGNGRFVRRNLPAFPGCRAVIASDLDHDGDIDFVVAGGGGMLWLENGLIDDEEEPVLPASPSANARLPESLCLFSATPNPFNSTTTLRFSLPRNERATLRVFDVLGRECALLLNHARLEAGEHSVIWSPNHAASGVYFVLLNTDLENVSQKLLYLR